MFPEFENLQVGKAPWAAVAGPDPVAIGMQGRAAEPVDVPIALP
ncbi:hypothetical protein ACIBJF_37875 [Streptomyces sp. NPDC050743]